MAKAAHEGNGLPAALGVVRGELVFAEGSVHGWEGSEPRLSLAKFQRRLKRGLHTCAEPRQEGAPPEAERFKTGGGWGEGLGSSL